MSKVLVLGPDRKTRGGISTVIKEYEKTDIWQEFNCKWIGTYIDRNNFIKVIYLISGFFRYTVSLPFYNIIHIHISWSTTAVRKLPFFVLAKILNKKVVLHVHSAAEPIINTKKQFPYKYMFERADVSVFLAVRIKDELQQSYKIKKSIVIYNPCTTNAKSLSSGIIERKKQVVFAGTITEKKGYIDLIRAFGRIASNNKEWTLVFAGNGEIENAKQICRDIDIENRVIFKGWIGRDELQNLLGESAIFCLPSYTEGFPMAVIEAWSYGAAVITTPVGGLPDVLIDRENALVFQPGDVLSLSHQLETLMSDENLRSKLGKHSVTIANTLFRIDTISSQLRELYISILENN